MGNHGNFCLGRTIGAFLLLWSGFSRWTPQTLPHLSSYILWTEVTLGANDEFKPGTDCWFFSQGFWGLDNGKHETIILCEEQGNIKVPIVVRNSILYSKSEYSSWKCRSLPNPYPPPMALLKIRPYNNLLVLVQNKIK